MIEKFCTEILRARISSWLKKGWSNLEILVLQEFSLIQDLKLRQSLELHTIFLPKSSPLSHIHSSQIFGPLVFSSTKCAHYSHHSMLNHYISLHKRFFKENMQTYLCISVKILQVSWELYSTKNHQNVLILTKFSNFLALLIELKNFWMKKILKTSSLTQFFIIKTYLTNSKQFKPERRQLKKSRKRKKLKKPRKPRENNKSLKIKWQQWG